MMFSSVPRRCMSMHVKNAFGVPLIPSQLHEQLFGQPQLRQKIKDSLKNEALSHLSAFKIKPDTSTPQATQISVDSLPTLHGNVEEHFRIIAEQQIKPYVNAANSLKISQIPPFPEQWSFNSGWTKYDKNGKAHSINVPDAQALVFDIELCVQEGPWPLMAAAVSPDAWYSWVSPYLVDLSLKPLNKLCLSQDDLIPIGDPTLVIGHNVSFDRARIGDQYALQPKATRFLDTMALHIAVGGMTSSQRMFKVAEKAGNPLLNDASPKWMTETSMNGLNDVHKFYLPNEKRLQKDIRDTFVSGSIRDVVEDFQVLMTYCANDVKATLQVFNIVFPLFRERCPHPVTLSGMLTMSNAYLPVQPSWFQFIDECDNVALELDQEIEMLIARQANEACQLLHGSLYKEDIWLWDLDWKCAPLKIKKGTKKALNAVLTSQEPKSEIEILEKKFFPLLNRAVDLYKTQPRRPGYPRWYTDQCSPYDYTITPKLADLGYSKAIVPKLLRLTWLGYPIHRDEKMKWGYLMPHEDIKIFQDLQAMNDEDLDSPRFPLSNYKSMMERSSKIAVFKGDSSSFDFIGEPPDFHALGEKVKKPHSEIGFELDNVPGCIFHQLPHKDGKGLSVGNPLGKAFLDKIQSGVLSTYADNPEESGQLAEKVLKVSKMMSYWKSSRDRIRSQIVVKANDDNMAILPQIVTAGTVTRRAVEKTWLTASNAKEDRVGSELKAMVVAPEGYTLVGADVDSQELWIAAVIGDAHFTGEHGSTALGWMTLQGNKNDGTDLHSATAKTVGVTRNEAKVLNYGRIYGAGVKFASQLLRNFNPNLSDRESVNLANKMYHETKGDRKYELNRVGLMCYNIHFGSKDFTNGVIVEKSKLSKIMNERLKLDLLILDDLTKLKLNASTTFTLSEAGMEVADNFSIPYEGDKITFENLHSLSQMMGPIKKSMATHDYVELRSQITKRAIWFGGSESFTFNKLEEIALTWQAKTPVLGCAVSRALESKVVGNDYLPSRINWVVQSSAVDYLHLLLAAMQWLLEDYDIEARFVISIHDEVRYLVAEKDAYRAGLALQFANLLVRAMFCKKLGMNSMPLDVAFFSGVDVDKVMRKEPQADCVTPSNPQGLFHGYGVPVGECLTIKDILMKTRGSLKKC